MHRVVAVINSARGTDEWMLELNTNDQRLPAVPSSSGRSTRARKSKVPGSLEDHGSSSEEQGCERRDGEESDDLDVPLA